MKRLFPFVFVTVWAVSCSHNSKPLPAEKPETYSPVEGSLGFEVNAVGNSDRVLLGSYSSNGKTAKFRIELDEPTLSRNANLPIFFGKGKFVVEPGSEPEGFISDLAEVLEARKLPNGVRRSPTLPFEYAVLGRNQSRSNEGGFADSPGGHWTLLKLFFGDDQGEVYLNFNLAIKKPEFSIKDPDYGDYVIGELAKML
jgi:hypothetical protein